MMKCCLLFLIASCFILKTSADNDSNLSSTADEDADNSSDTEIECDCGQRHRLYSRIVGGEKVAIQQYPWMVAISVFGNAVCGGAIISDRYILTAAHCFKHEEIRKLAKVKIGITSQNENVLDVEIDTIIQHELYRGNRSGFYDISLVKLVKPIIFNTRVFPICLPNVGESYVNQWATVAGWGVIKHDGLPSNDLQAAAVRVIPLDKCVAMYRKAKKLVTENNICAGGMHEKDACQGDSGSPLFVEKDGVFRVIGIVSWGIGCASKYPGIYTNVAYYYPWIIAKTNLSCYKNLN